MNNFNPRPLKKPKRPYFSSGPCAKPLSWSFDKLIGGALGRSHRSKIGKQKLKKVIQDHRDLLNIPESHLIGIVPASDTGAMELAMWSLLGPKVVDVLHWENFGSTWNYDIQNELKLESRSFSAPYGKLPDFTKVNFAHDVVFTWNGTTSGVCVPNGEWIDANRTGLTFCDATSAVFAMSLPWDKLDVTTWSWQKVLGGEAAHGMLVLSPKAVERLRNWTPSWPMPKIFRLTQNGELNSKIFEGETINTPSMLCVEDILFSLNWAQNLGGHEALMSRSQKNLQIVESWVEQKPWIDFLCQDSRHRSSTSICLTFTDNIPSFLDKNQIPEKIAILLEDEKIAYDINAHKAAPSGLRIWGGPTILPSDIKELLPWIEWAYYKVTQG